MIGSSSITVTELGRMRLSNNTRVHTLKIVDAATGVDVVNASVNVSLEGQAIGQFVYAKLPTAVTLAANRAYFIVSSESVVQNAGDFFYDWDGYSQTTGVAALQGGVYWSGRWTALGSTNQMIGPVSFKYRTN